MTAIKQHYQELFYYLRNELDVIATHTEMQEIEALVISKHEQQVKDAYNQGHRDGKEDWDFVMHKDISEYSNAQNYYNETFNK